MRSDAWNVGVYHGIPWSNHNARLINRRLANEETVSCAHQSNCRKTRAKYIQVIPISTGFVGVERRRNVKGSEPRLNGKKERNRWAM